MDQRRNKAMPFSYIDLLTQLSLRSKPVKIREISIPVFLRILPRISACQGVLNIRNKLL